MSSARVLLLAYLGVLAVLVFLPFGRGMELGDRLNVDPFATIERAFELGPRSPSFRLMLGNIAAFVPFGVLLPLAFRLRWPVFSVGVAALALSVGIELGQSAISSYLGYAYRSTDIDDVILNVFGALIGAVVFAVIQFARTVGAESTESGT